MGHPWVPTLDPPLVTFHISPLAVFATVAVGVASHVHVLETGVRGRPGTCREGRKVPHGMGKAASREKYLNQEQWLDASGENTMEKSPGELLLRVLGQEQHKGGEIPFSLGSSREFWPWGRISPVPAAALLGAPTGAGPGGGSTAMEMGTYVPCMGWEQ